MSLRAVLTAAATLALASLSPLVAAPALAQEAPAASADGQADMAAIQSAAQTLQAEIAQLAPRAEAIRNDASLSDADKRSRIEALASEKQPQIDAFTAVIGRFATAQARAQGASDADLANMMPMIQAEIRNRIIAGLMGSPAQ